VPGLAFLVQAIKTISNEYIIVRMLEPFKYVEQTKLIFKVMQVCKCPVLYSGLQNFDSLARSIISRQK